MGTCRGLSMYGPRSLGYDSKELSEINYLGLLLSRMSRTVKVSDL